MTGLADTLRDFNDTMRRRADAMRAERAAVEREQEEAENPRSPALLEARALARHCQNQTDALRAMVGGRWVSGSEGPVYNRRFVKGAGEVLEEARRSCGSELQAIALTANVCVVNGWITDEQRRTLDLKPPVVPEAETERAALREHYAAWQRDFDAIIDAVKARALQSKGRRAITPGAAFARVMGIWNRGAYRKYDDGALATFRGELRAAGLL